MATPNMLEDQDNRRDAKARGLMGDQGPGNVDKIRDILFGSQMRDYETRFNRLEESLRKETADLKETTRKRFDSLESYLKRELESLEARLKTERDERTESARQLASDLKALNDNLSRKISEVNESAVTGERNLRRDLLQQTQDLSEEIRSKIENLTGILDRRVAELRNDKTDRAALAAMLTEVAMRLNNEFQIPGGE